VANWFTRMFKSEKRSISYQDFWGSGGDVADIHSESIGTALRLAPVYAATRLLADTIASLPLQAYQNVHGARRKVPTPGLFGDPTSFGTVVEWVQRIMTSLTLRGNAWGYVTQFDEWGRPAQIEWLHPDDVSLYGQNRSLYRPQWYWLGRPLEPERVVHIPGYVLPGEILGISPITAYALTTETGILSQEFGRDWFRNGSVPSAVLETEQPVTQDNAKIIKSRFMAAANGREPVVLGAGTKYRPIAVNPAEAQYLETIKATANQIAAIYGVPPERIGGVPGGTLTYATREQSAIDLVTYSLRPYMVKLEATFNTLTPPDQYVKFNVDALTRADLQARYQAHHIALTDGWMSKDEVREIEDLPPLPDGLGTSYAPLIAGGNTVPVGEQPPKRVPSQRLRAVGDEND